MSRPRLLLLDEPSLGLAPRVIAEIFSVLDELRAQGVTILLVEQDARLALKHADRGFVMRTGRVVLEGSAGRLCSPTSRCGPSTLARGAGKGGDHDLEPRVRVHGPRGAARAAAAPAPDDDLVGLRARPALPRSDGREGVRPRDIRTLDDVRRLPFADKAALQGDLSVRRVRAAARRGGARPPPRATTGKPIVVGYSRGDINTWTELTARVAAAAGVHRGDLVQMAFLYGMFTGGWGMHYGIERIGATIIPAGSGQTERHLLMMEDFGTTVLVSTPSTLSTSRNRRGTRRRLLHAQAPARTVRRRALLRQMKRRDRDEARYPRHRQLRAVRGDGTRSRRRVRVHLRPARQRGPPPPRVIDPTTGEQLRLRRGGRTRHHDADQGGVPGLALPHARPDRARSVALRVRTHARADEQGSPAYR